MAESPVERPHTAFIRIPQRHLLTLCEKSDSKINAGKSQVLYLVQISVCPVFYRTGKFSFRSVFPAQYRKRERHVVLGTGLKTGKIPGIALGGVASFKMHRTSETDTINTFGQRGVWGTGNPQINKKSKRLNQ